MFPASVVSTPADVMVVQWFAGRTALYLELATELRAAGLRVELYPEPPAADGRKVGDKQFKYASARGIPFVAVIGADELEKGSVTVKNMRTGEQSAHPRAVVAADRGPPLRPERSGMLLADRLYLGYQEKAATIEVISYNEAAGRFEFQVVRDYREGGEAKVYYADRPTCVACHRNHAPIFSRPLWDETNANAAIAATLASVRDAFYGIPVARGRTVLSRQLSCSSSRAITAGWI